MAISPVSSVSFRNNYNQINFEGKRKEKNGSVRHSTSSLKAVPLAVMLAMSPLNSVEAQNNAGHRVSYEIVNTKEYDGVIAGNKALYSLLFRFRDSDSNKATVEDVRVQSQDLISALGGSALINNATLKSVNNYTLRLVGADGRLGSTITHSQLELRGMENSEGRRRYYPIANEEIVADLTAFARSNRNNGAVEIRNIENTLYARPNAFPSDIIKPDFSWMAKTKQTNPNFGTEISETGISTQKSDYKVRYYSSDNDNNTVESVVCERDDGVRFRVDGLRLVKLNIKASDTYSANPLPVACIDISWPNVGQFTILDDELFMNLLNMVQYKNFENAVDLSEVAYNIIVNSDGSITKAKN